MFEISNTAVHESHDIHLLHAGAAHIWATWHSRPVGVDAGVLRKQAGNAHHSGRVHRPAREGRSPDTLQGLPRHVLCIRCAGLHREGQAGPAADQYSTSPRLSQGRPDGLAWGEDPILPALPFLRCCDLTSCKASLCSTEPSTNPSASSPGCNACIQWHVILPSVAVDRYEYKTLSQFCTLTKLMCRWRLWTD